MLEQLFHLLLADVVVLEVVEDRNQDVQVRQQFAQRRGLRERHGVVRTLAPLGELLVQRIPDGLDLVAQRLEDFVQEVLAAPARQHFERGDQRDRRAGQFGAFLGAAIQCRAEHLGNRHAHERRGHVGPVVDVLGQDRLGNAAPAPHHRHRVHVQQQGGRAAVLGRLGVENVGLPETERKTLAAGRVLVQQVAEIRGGPVRRRKCQQHRK